jgi:outer membrane murein-binding lipoprotein Lpp
MFLPTEEYKKEILTGGTNVQMPRLTQEMNSKLTELESKIQELQSFGDNLAQKIESAAVSSIKFLTMR